MPIHIQIIHNKLAKVYRDLPLAVHVFSARVAWAFLRRVVFWLLTAAAASPAAAIGMRRLICVVIYIWFIDLHLIKRKKLWSRSLRETRGKHEFPFISKLCVNIQKRPCYVDYDGHYLNRVDFIFI